MFTVEIARAAVGAADVRLPRHTEGPGEHPLRPTEDDYHGK